MALVFDRVARTYFMTNDSTVTVRSHSRDRMLEGRRCIQRQRMRQGAKEVLSVLARAVSRLSFEQIKAQLPHVEDACLHWRLSKLEARGDIDRTGTKFSFRYALPMNSTFATT